MKDELRCYNVICKDIEGNKYEIGVICRDEFSAKHCAEHSLFEGKKLKVKAIEVIETDSI